jgi:hypothetical protein
MSRQEPYHKLHCGCPCRRGKGPLEGAAADLISVFVLSGPLPIGEDNIPRRSAINTRSATD